MPVDNTSLTPRPTPQCVSSPSDVVHALTNEWISHNKSRIYSKKSANACAVKCAPTPVNTHTDTRLSAVTHTNRHVSESLQRVIASRQDIRAFDDNAYTPESCSGLDYVGYVKDASNHATAMGVLERQIMMTTCDERLSANIPYSTGTGFDKNFITRVGGNDLVASTCCAYINTQSVGMSVGMSGGVGGGVRGAVGGAKRQVYLPISTPCMDQIAKCNESVVYNRNVQANIVSALTTEHIKVHHTNAVENNVTGKDGIRELGTVYIDENVPIQALGTIPVLEDILFGDYRITSSPNFCLGTDIGKTYVSAMHKFQKYTNTRIGDNLTLTPSFHKRMPVVISMSCPQGNLFNTVTTSTLCRNHGTFGPNHPERLVEVMGKLAPFVKQCSESLMMLHADTVMDLVEDQDMPVASSVDIQHCFANNPAHGVSAYVASHEFSIPTAILNTHVVVKNNNATTADKPFPVETKFVVHVAALFGGSVSDVV
jgi:hypothetical protein